MKPSSLVFLAMLRDAGIKPPVTEHRFDAVRRWRMDYAWPDLKIALEVEGGIWSRGRHTRGAGFLKDCEKYNEAAIAGWTVLRTTPSALCSAETISMIKRAAYSK